MGLSEKSESPFFVQRNSEQNDFDLVLTLFLYTLRIIERYIKEAMFIKKKKYKQKPNKNK